MVNNVTGKHQECFSPLWSDLPHVEALAVDPNLFISLFVQLICTLSDEEKSAHFLACSLRQIV